MRRARVIAAVLWCALSSWLLVWVTEELVRTDQRLSVLPLRDSGDLVAPLMIGCAWGFTGMALGVLSRACRHAAAHDLSSAVTATGQVVEIHQAGISQWVTDDHSAPLVYVLVRVDPAGGEPFLGTLVTHAGAISVGDTVPVRYLAEDPDLLYAAAETVPH